VTETPFDALLIRAGGVRGLVSSALPVATFGAASAVSELPWAIVAAVGTAALVMVWQLARRDTVRPAVLGFIGVVVCAAFAFFTGQAKNFYLPGIWMYLALAVVFTTSVLIRRPIIGVTWAWVTGRDDTWRRIPRVRMAFDAVTALMAVVSWTRFVVQYYLYDTDQAGLLAVARIAMGWPIFVVTTTLIYLTIRMAIRALPRQPSATS
jgi:Protein of unknown function (DUF3159)